MLAGLADGRKAAFCSEMEGEREGQVGMQVTLWGGGVLSTQLAPFSPEPWRQDFQRREGLGGKGA